MIARKSFQLTNTRYLGRDAHHFLTNDGASLTTAGCTPEMDWNSSHDWSKHTA
jgi:hypothetical protein